MARGSDEDQRRARRRVAVEHLPRHRVAALHHAGAHGADRVGLQELLGEHRQRRKRRRRRRASPPPRPCAGPAMPHSRTRTPVGRQMTGELLQAAPAAPARSGSPTGTGSRRTSRRGCPTTSRGGIRPPGTAPSPARGSRCSVDADHPGGALAQRLAAEEALVAAEIEHREPFERRSPRRGGFAGSRAGAPRASRRTARRPWRRRSSGIARGAWRLSAAAASGAPPLPGPGPAPAPDPAARIRRGQAEAHGPRDAQRLGDVGPRHRGEAFPDHRAVEQSRIRWPARGCRDRRPSRRPPRWH